MLSKLSLGLLAVPCLIMTVSSQAAIDLDLIGDTIRLHGRVVAQPCVVSPESIDQSVNMDTVDVAELYANGGGALVPFSIKLANCRPNIFRMAKVTFTGQKDPKLTNGLIFSPGSTARGAGIRLFDNDRSRLDLDVPSRGYLLSSTSINELRFFARVEGHSDTLAGKNIQPGNYSAVTNFVVSYE